MSLLEMTSTELRELVLSALQDNVSTEYGAPPPPHQFFVPKTHARALNLNVPVVLGDRGTGKSYWWAALQSSPHRALLARFASDTRIRLDTWVRPGFGKTLAPDNYPSKDVLAKLLANGHKPRLIWKAVALRAFAREGQGLSDGDWSDRVAWLEGNPEPADRILHDTDRALHAEGRDALLVFDALDDAADEREALFVLIEGLAQLALELRGSQHLRAKVFLRTDQFEDPRVGRFPDASKLRASTVTLSWLTTELFGLLWQLLGNHPALGSRYRQDLYLRLYQSRVKERGLSPEQELEILLLSRASEWTPPSEAQFDPKTQDRLFQRLAGLFMGESARKGFPYNWLPTHLADAHGNISPRSFLTALSTAAAHTADHYPNHDFAIHFRSLHAGVHEASRIRLGEVDEYHWVKPLLRPLAGRVEVPFDFADVEAIWRDENLLNDPEVRRAEISKEAIGRDRLMQLGVWRQMKTGRIDVPDIYRLGFGLARRGGVPLVKDGEVRR